MYKSCTSHKRELWLWLWSLLWLWFDRWHPQCYAICLCPKLSIFDKTCLFSLKPTLRYLYRIYNLCEKSWNTCNILRLFDWYSLSPSKECLFIGGIHPIYKSAHLQITFRIFISTLILKGGVVIPSLLTRNTLLSYTMLYLMGAPMNFDRYYSPTGKSNRKRLLLLLLLLLGKEDHYFKM